MITSHSVNVPKRAIDADKLSYFRFGALADGFILTNDQGRWHHLDQGAFYRLLRGELEPGHGQYDALAAKGFLRDQTPLDDVAALIRARKRFVGAGPTHHRIRLTGADGPLTVETAKDILDFVMLSSAAALDIELIAGPSGWNHDIVAFIVQYTTEKNRYEGKVLTWRLTTDLSALPEGSAAWLIDKRFQVRTHLHGDPSQHDAARGDGPDHATVSASIGALHEAAGARSKADWRVQADVHVTRANVGAPDSVIDGLAAAGIQRFRLQPQLQGDGAITAAEFKAFYDAALGTILARTGDPLVEEAGAAVVGRALRHDAPPDVESRSPGGWGTGLVVYDAAGRVFPSDLAADLYEQGDDLFLVGRAGETSYKDCMSHPTLRTLAMASLTECLPAFGDHWATPFCGVDPVADYAHTGDLFPKLPTSEAAAATRAVVEAVFVQLVRGDGDTTGRLEQWAQS